MFVSWCSFNLLRKRGLLAHTSAAFLKNCCIEKLFSCLRLVLGKPPESGSARLGHIPSLPRESQLPLKPCISLQPLDFKGNCDSSDCFFRCLFYLMVQVRFASQMWAARPHLGSIFEKLLHRKTFSCLRLGSYSQHATKFVSRSTILSTSFEKMVEIGNTTPHIHIHTFPS